MQKVYAIIPAGGSGSRVGGETPKQFLSFGGKELIVYTIEVFQLCDLVDEIIIPTKKEYVPLMKKLKSKFKLDKITKIIEGGSERQYSVLNALNSVTAEKNDLIAVHDAARPLLPLRILNNTIRVAQSEGTAITAIKAKDTLVHGGTYIQDYIDRKDVYYIQTPQIFTYEVLSKAMNLAKDENFIGTDESMLVKRCGEKVFLTEGSSLNFKVTTHSDIELFQRLLEKERGVN